RNEIVVVAAVESDMEGMLSSETEAIGANFLNAAQRPVEAVSGGARLESDVSAGDGQDAETRLFGRRAAAVPEGRYTFDRTRQAAVVVNDRPGHCLGGRGPGGRGSARGAHGCNGDIHAARLRVIG